MADASVRPARPDDAADIARIQLVTWRTAYTRTVPASVLDAVTDEMAQTQWSAAITAPPTPRHRVLVATEGDFVVGFVALGPAEPDPDTSVGDGVLDVTTLLVEPRWGRRGHGSRLLASAIDTTAGEDYRSAISWILANDMASESFFASAGWAPDGVRRTLDMEGTAVQEIRLHTSLVDV